MTKPPQHQLLILGANGKLGRLLQKAWAKAPLPGWQARWCARSNGHGIDHVWQPGMVAPQRAEAVVALWGVVPGGGDLEDNTRLAQAAMALGRASGASRVLHFSSAAVYGAGTQLSETSPCQPLNAYGAAKLAMEAAIAQETGPAACVLRLANVVGGDSLFAALTSETPMVIDKFPDGQGPRRSYAPPSVIWHAVAALLTCPTMPEVINVAAPGTVDMSALAHDAGREFSWKVAPEEALAEAVLDTARLQALAGALTPATSRALIAEWQALRAARA